MNSDTTPAENPCTEDEDRPNVDPERVADRANLLPEEKRAGSDDPEAQAKAILEDSNERMEQAIEEPHSAGERRTSDEAT